MGACVYVCVFTYVLACAYMYECKYVCEAKEQQSVCECVHRLRIGRSIYALVQVGICTGKGACICVRVCICGMHVVLLHVDRDQTLYMYLYIYIYITHICIRRDAFHYREHTVAIPAVIYSTIACAYAHFVFTSESI